MKKRFATDDMSPLRAAIDATDSFDRHRHSSIVAELTGTYSHRIEYRGLNEEGNCATFALGLTENAIDLSVASRGARHTIVGRDFIEWLIRNHLSELEKPVPGSLALYFHEQVWQHIGVVAAHGRIVSQWGRYPIYEHDVFEVPTGYGNNVRYFKMIDSAEALSLFREYAGAAGLPGDQMTRTHADHVHHRRRALQKKYLDAH